MQLDERDIEAIGKSRANRDIPKDIKYWLYGGAITGGLAALVLVFYSANWYVFGIGLLGAAACWYGTKQADKWRRNIISKLRDDYNAELDSR